MGKHGSNCIHVRMEQGASRLFEGDEHYEIPIEIEIMSSNGYFFLDFVQQWQEELYFEAFCQQLTLQGIPYEREGLEAHRVFVVELP